MDFIAQIQNRMAGPRGPIAQSAPKVIMIGISAALVIPMLFCGRKPPQDRERPPIIQTQSQVSAAQLKALRDQLNRQQDHARKQQEELERALQAGAMHEGSPKLRPPSMRRDV